ncbi:uncharacterized protein TrAtP1_010276 [Trichoderma atroviride]|uniref:uncharacterized protein n=1 Tax=Hypocrea atroviridis TaxID=63577 RepID=UPI003316F860|nr:hypothetical protein TrAtP1_010276 [Trichoderma atroviride]
MDFCDDIPLQSFVAEMCAEIPQLPLFHEEIPCNQTAKEDLGEENFGLASVKRVPVPHCWRSFGTQLELTSGLKIAYSGDCRPSKLFAQECRGAHLLKHECTLGDDKQDHAKVKKHSTIGVAREMQARRTLLDTFPTTALQIGLIETRSRRGRRA